MTIDDEATRIAEHIVQFQTFPPAICNLARAYLDATEWRTMESAPKTGVDLIEKCVLGYCAGEDHPGDRMKVVWWEPKIKGGKWWSDADMECQPTHWLPLPRPPK